MLQHDMTAYDPLRMSINDDFNSVLLNVTW